MATWTTIPDSSLEPGKPIRSIDTLALRDNPVAIAEGAAGAPKVQPEGMLFYPTQQGGGSGMLTNKIYIGWNGSSILGQVDASPQGAICMSGYGVGAVGTYAFLGETTSTTTEVGATRAGSFLRYSGAVKTSAWNTSTSLASSQSMYGQSVNTAPAGTWRAMGYAKGGVLGESSVYPATLWLRIA